MPTLRKKRFLPSTPINVEVQTPSSKKRLYDLLDKKNLDKIGISRSDIKEVETIFAIPGYLYEEKGVAGRYHRLVGSACAAFTLHDNRKYSVDDLWFFDENTKRTHFGGREHWNHERRIVEHSSGGPKILHFIEHVEGQVIPASPYLDISLDPGPEGKRVKKRIFRP